jgi:hypothetical protein
VAVIGALAFPVPERTNDDVVEELLLGKVSQWSNQKFEIDFEIQTEVVTEWLPIVQEEEVKEVEEQEKA